MKKTFKMALATIALSSVAVVAGAQGYGGYGGGAVEIFYTGGGGGGYYTSPTTTVGQVLGASTTAAMVDGTAVNFKFNINMAKGSKISDVKKLQAVLVSEGFLPTSSQTGFFGPMTFSAVKKYQTKNNVSPVSGFVGPLTRAVLNK
jgi:peptidoglycan hydrolase-like protein with peptidoglycan-binding domain